MYLAVKDEEMRRKTIILIREECEYIRKITLSEAFLTKVSFPCTRYIIKAEYQADVVGRV